MTTTMTHSSRQLPKSFRHHDGALEHQCSRCRQWLPATGDVFTREKGNRFGLGYQCRSCNRKAMEEWRKSNPKASCGQRIRSYYRHRDAGGKFTNADREALLAEYMHCCCACALHESIVGRLEIDHVDPDGTNSYSNRQPLCRRCNAEKSNKAFDYRPSFLSRIRRAA